MELGSIPRGRSNHQTALFLGTTTAPVRAYLAQEIRSRKPKRVFEPFAGIFMISQICGMIDPEIEVWSTDISMFSAAIGCGLSGQEAPIRRLPLFDEHFPTLVPLTSPVHQAAIMIFMQEAALAYRKRHLVFYGKLWDEMRIRAHKHVQGVVEKVEKAKANLPKRFHYSPSCGVELMKQAQAGDMLFYDPPFWTGGYEKMFEALQDWFVMDPIPFVEVTTDLKAAHLQELHERGVACFYRCEKEETHPHYEKVFQAEHKLNGYFLVYANHAETRGILRNDRMREKAKLLDVADETFRFTPKTKIALVPVDTPTANHFRLMWTKKAEMQNMGSPYLLAADGKVFGVVVVDSGQQFGTSLARIVSDVSSLFTAYPRLSKLVLGMILTDEFLHEINNRFMHTHDGFTTTAFSDEQVSMKYRGLFDLAERRPGEEGQKKYALVYRTRKMRAPTYRAAFKQWLQKHGNPE